MQTGLVINILVALFFTQAACQKKDPKDSTSEAEAAGAEESDAPATADQTVENLPPATCKSLNIPSYDLWIKDLSALRCDSCHNETFAWQGIILTNYDGYKTYTKAIRNRVFYNLLSQPLEPGEQEIFLTWIDNGLPRTESDCANLSPASKTGS